MHNLAKMATGSSVHVDVTREDENAEYCVINEDGKDEIVSETDKVDLIETEDNETTDATANISSSSDNTSEYLPLEKAKSQVWKYFGFPAQSGQFIQKDKRLRKEVFCKLCQQSLSYKGNTTNMIVHLQYRYAAEYSELVIPIKSKATGFKSSALRNSGQSSIEDSFKRMTPLSRSSSRWKALINAVCYFVAKDQHPVATVNDPGFIRMLKIFEPRYIIPDRTTFSRHYLPHLYEKEKEKVLQQMKAGHGHGLEWYAVTTDGWSSQANNSYVSITLHYINNEWDMKCFLLETGEIVEEHTAINLANYLEEGLARWNLSIAQISVIVTDNASNITAAIYQLGCQRFGCFSHTLRLSVQKALNLSSISRALGRAKRLVSHFHSSTKSTNVLRQKRRDLKYKEHKLIQVHINLLLHTYFTTYYIIL